MFKSKLAVNILSRVLVTAVEFIAALICFPYAAKVLLPAGMGQIDYVNSIVAYFITFAAFGITEYGGREVARSKSDILKLDQIVSDFFAAKIILASFLSIVYLIGVLFFQQKSLSFFIVSAFFIFSSAFNLVWAIEALEDFVYVAVSKFIVKIGYVACLFTLVTSPSDTLKYFIIMGIFDLLFFLSSLLRLKFKYKVSFSFSGLVAFLSLDRIKKLVRIFVINIIQSAISNAPVVSLGYFSTFHQVGIFSVAYRFLMIGLYGIVPISTVFLSKSMSYQDGDISLARYEHLDRTLSSLILFSVPVAFGLFAVSEPTIRLLVGSEYQESVLILKLLCPLLIILSLNNFWGLQVIFSMKKDSKLLYINLAGLAVILPVLILLVPRYGAIGAAIGMIISYAFLALIYMIVGKKYHSSDTTRLDQIKCYASGLSMLVFIELVSVANYYELAAKIVLGAIIYFVSLGLLRHSFVLNLLPRR